MRMPAASVIMAFEQIISFTLRSITLVTNVTIMSLISKTHSSEAHLVVMFRYCFPRTNGTNIKHYTAVLQHKF